MSQEQTGNPGYQPDDELQEGGQKQIQSNNVDDLLDDIDELLATDVQSFVSGFVQKGGQ